MTERILIYQVLPRLYGNKNTTNKPGGTIEENGCGKMKDFTAAALDRIRQFGFTHIWYTGLLEHATQTDYSAYGIRRDNPEVVKGAAGSPYAIKDYYDIDPDLATEPDKRMREFENLVKRTHRAGLKMVIDFVPNHVARQYFSDARPKGVRDLGEDDDTSKGFDPENNFYYICGQTLHCPETGIRSVMGPYREYPAKATGNDRFDAYPQINDWYETVKLNYGIDYMNGRSAHFSPIPSTWRKMTDILLFWAAKGVDAFRCDMAEMVPVAFWNHAIAAVKKAYPHIQFIAEVYNPAEYANYIYTGRFDYLYDKVGLYDTLRAVTAGYAPASAITGCWQAVEPYREHMLNFLENHDEQRIASPMFAGAARKAIPALVVSACMFTNPFMVYAGQELGEPGMDSEGFSGTDGRTTIFDYWGVRTLQQLAAGAKKLTDEQQALYDTYQRIVTLCNESEALREGQFHDLMYANQSSAYAFDAQTQYAFMRGGKKEKLLIVANFSNRSASMGVCIPQHAFDHLKLRPGLRSAVDLMSGNSVTVNIKAEAPTYVTVPAYSAVILKF